MKKMLSAFLACIMIITNLLPIFADEKYSDNLVENTIEETTEKIQQDKNQNVEKENIVDENTKKVTKTNINEERYSSSIRLGQTVSGIITSSNKNDIYSLNLNKSGRVNLEYKTYIYDSYVQILDSKGKSIYKTEVYYGYEDEPKYKTISLDLEAGIYNIKIYPYGSNTGKYTLKVTNTPANNNDIEPNNGTETAQNLSLNQTITGFISETDKNDYYKVNINKSGRNTFEYKTYIYDSYIQILDSKGKSIYKTEVYYGYEDEPKYKTISLDLEAGIYYIKVYPYGSNTGKYTLKVTNTPANNNDIEPNNGTETAQNLSLNQTITGFISETDKNDYYKINKTNNGKIKIKYNSYIYDSYIQILDSKGNSIYKTEVYYGYDNNPKYKELELDLSKGVYYIRIYPYGSNTGKYTLQVVDPNLKTMNLAVNYVTTESTVIKGKGLTGAKVKAYINGKQIGKVATVNSSGVYSITIPKQKTGTKVTLKANKSGYMEARKDFTIMHKFKTFTVNTVDKTSTKIRGKGEPGAQVRALINGKQIGNLATVASNGAYNITIPRQKAGTKITIKMTKAGYFVLQQPITVLK